MSAQGLSELHVLPQKQTVDAEYYVTKILKQSLPPALSRSDTTGSVLQRKMVPAMSVSIFMQDGAPANTSKRAQNWCRENVPMFWDKHVRPGNSLT